MLRRFNVWSANYEWRHPIAAALLLAVFAAATGLVASVLFGGGANWGYAITFAVFLTIARAVRNYKRRATKADQP